MILGTSDAWSMSHSSQQLSKLEYYIEDCQIFLGTNWPAGRHAAPTSWLAILGAILYNLE